MGRYRSVLLRSDADAVKTLLLPTVKWLMTTTLFLLVMAVVIVGSSFALSYATDQWHWFQRSGALLVSIGVILSTRRLLRVGIDGMIQGSSYFDIATQVDMSHDTARNPETHRDLVSAYCGFVVVGLGTVVWAYGDLIECLLAFNLNCIA